MNEVHIHFVATLHCPVFPTPVYSLSFPLIFLMLRTAVFDLPLVVPPSQKAKGGELAAHRLWFAMLC
jgi:hypothetical protein